MGASLAGLFLLAPSASAVGTVDQVGPAPSGSSGSPVTIGGTGTSAVVGQTFTAGRTGGLDRVELRLLNFDCAAPNTLKVEIRSMANATVPGNTVLGTGTVTANNFNGQSATDITVAITPTSPATSVQVTAGTKYAIVLSTTCTGSYWWMIDFNASSPYPGGQLLRGTLSGSNPSWVSASNLEDAIFKTYVDSAGPAISNASPMFMGRTANQAPTFTGVGGTESDDLAPLTLKIYSDSPAGSLLQTRNGTVGAGGSYSINTTNLGDGVYTAVLSQSDKYGNVGEDSLPFRIASGIPEPSMTGPSEFTNSTTPSFSGAAPTGLPSGQFGVLIYAGATASGTAIQSRNATFGSGNNWTATATTLAEGRYTARAQQRDSLGYMGYSNPVTFNVDTTAPAPTITTPAEGSRTNDQTPSVSGVGASAPGDLGTAKVIIKDNAGDLETKNVAFGAGGSWQFDASSLPEGSYSVRIEQSDQAGNTSQVVSNFRIDLTPPNPSLTSPTEGQVSTGSFMQIYGVAGTAAGDTNQVSGKLFRNGFQEVSIPSVPVDPGGSFYVGSFGVNPDSTYVFELTQTDSAGNSRTITRNFRMDNTGPSPTLTTPADGSATNDTTPQIAGVAGTATGDNNQVEVNLWEGSGTSGTLLQTKNAPVGAGGAYEVDADTLPEGTYTVRASQSDSVNNTGAPSAPRTFTVDTTAPAVTLTSPADGAAMSTETPTFSGAAGDLARDGNDVTVDIYAGPGTSGTPLQSRSVGKTGDSYETQVDALADGVYTAVASQDDSAGNTGSSSEVAFEIDTTGPAPTITAPNAGATTNDNTPSIAGTGGTDPRDQATVKVKIFSGGSAAGAAIQTLDANLNGSNYSIDPASLADGTYTATATQEDSLGNSGTSAPRTFTVDTAVRPPDPPGPPNGTDCVVPSIKKGAKLKAAKKAITGAGCSVGKIKKKPSAKIKKGRVIKLKPKAGAQLPADGAVSLVVSSGPKRK